MPVDMNTITSMISHWLAKSDIEREGVKIVLEFPTEEAARRTEMTIKREIEPLMSYTINRTFNEVETMNGIGLALRVVPRRRS